MRCGVIRLAGFGAMSLRFFRARTLRFRGRRSLRRLGLRWRRSLTACWFAPASPYARRGALWDAYRKYYGKDDASVLVWRAPTVVMNPSVPRGVIEEAFEADPASAAAEYGAEFRTDVETFVSREAIEACVSFGVRERPPVLDEYYIGVRRSGGGSADAMTLAVGHRQLTTDGDRCLARASASVLA